MAEDEYQRGQAGIALARWQGGVDAALKSHEERLDATGGDIRAIRQSQSDQRDDLREINRVLKAQAETARSRAGEGRFRWTKATVFIAAIAVLATIILNLYFASGSHH